MRRSSGVILAAVAAVAACASSAKGLYTNHESAFKAAEASGRPVLIVYAQQTTCPIAIGARDFILKNRTNQGFLARNFVVAEVQIALGGKRYQEYRRQFTGKFIPFWVVAAPDGQFIAGGDCQTIDQGASSQWRKRIGKIAADHPPISKAQRDKAAEALAQAQRHFDSGRYADAHQAAMSIADRVWYPKDLPGKSKELAEKIARRGRELLDKADALAAKEKLVEAALAWDEIAAAFSSKHVAGKTASEKLRQTLDAHKDIAPEFNRLKRARQAEKLLAHAQALEKDGKNPQAAAAYLAIQRQYGQTPSAAKAKEALARLRPGGSPPATPPPGKAPAVSPAGGKGPTPAGRMLQMARNYHAAGMKDKARDKLLACIKAHRGTDAATQARKLLTEWGLPAPGK